MVQEVEVHQEGEEGDDKIYINSYSIKNINKLFLFLSYKFKIKFFFFFLYNYLLKKNLKFILEFQIYFRISKL